MILFKRFMNTIFAFNEWYFLPCMWRSISEMSGLQEGILNHRYFQIQSLIDFYWKDYTSWVLNLLTWMPEPIITNAKWILDHKSQLESNVHFNPLDPITIYETNSSTQTLQYYKSQLFGSKHTSCSAWVTLQYMFIS